jgi:DNA-binding NtrC family response regulator
MSSTTKQRDCVLVIDDDPDLRELCQILCADWGLMVLGASDCASALALLDREGDRVRAVLLDYFMPGTDPRKCAKAVVAKVSSDVPVILLSAAVDIAERAAEVGLRRFLAKPFEVNDLRAAVAA